MLSWRYGTEGQTMQLYWALQAFKLFMWVGPKEIVGRLNHIFLIISCIFLGAIWLSWVMIYNGVQHAKCWMGDAVVCAEYVEYTPDNIPPAVLAAWNAKQGAHDPSTGFDAFHKPVWSLAKWTWYDGEMVLMHRYCVGMDYPRFDGTDADSRCDDAEIFFGKHDFTRMPHMTTIFPYDLQGQFDKSPGYIPGAVELGSVAPTTNPQLRAAMISTMKQQKLAAH
jgi:hypothetical protein